MGPFVSPTRIAVFLHLFASEGWVIAKTLAIAVDKEEAAEEMLHLLRRAEFGVDSHIGIWDHALVEDLFVLQGVVVEEIQQTLNHLRQWRLELDNRAGFEGLVVTVDSPVPYLLSDLLGIIQVEMGKLDKSTSTAPFMRLKTKIEELRADPRYNFMFSGMLVGDTMASHEDDQIVVDLAGGVFIAF